MITAYRRKLTCRLPSRLNFKALIRQKAVQRCNKFTFAPLTDLLKTTEYNM